MRILGIYASPRKGGNSDILLDVALLQASEVGADVRRIFARDLVVPSCIGCGTCDNTGHCFMRDDFDRVLEEIDAADAMIFATPMHFYTVSAHGMGIISRAQSMWARRYVFKDEDVMGKPLKPGAVIAVGATNGKKIFDGLRLTMYYFFYAAGYNLSYDLFVPGVDQKGEILDKPDSIEKARSLGRSIATQTPSVLPGSDDGELI